jgi:hypothetical protein
MACACTNTSSSIACRCDAAWRQALQKCCHGRRMNYMLLLQRRLVLHGMNQYTAMHLQTE